MPIPCHCEFNDIINGCQHDCACSSLIISSGNCGACKNGFPQTSACFGREGTPICLDDKVIHSLRSLNLGRGMRVRKMKELHTDYLDRIGIKYKIQGEDEYGYWIGRSLYHSHYFKNPTTSLNTCQVCGKVSTPKKVHCRNDVFRWNAESSSDFTTKNKDILCMGCWNKIRPLVSRQMSVNENRRMINKLNKRRLQCQKSQTQVN